MSIKVFNTDFYPRSPCGERHSLPALRLIACQFLSTLSLRRATANGCTTIPDFGHFYPRSPCGERQQDKHHPHHGREFLSTLSLRRATSYFWGSRVPVKFLSTLSLRRATMHALIFADSVLFLSTLSLRRATAKVHKTVGHFCTYETNFMGIASSY